MIAIKIANTKEFMHMLLRTEIFDHFLLSEGSITTYMTFILDGHANKDFFSPEDEGHSLLTGSYVPFSLIRPACFDLIKGKRTPSSFRFVFLLSEENQQRTLDSLNSHFTVSDISGMYLNLKYQDNQITLTTGISYQIFSMDKSLEHSWDEMILRFLTNHGIMYESLT